MGRPVKKEEASQMVTPGKNYFNLHFSERAVSLMNETSRDVTFRKRALHDHMTKYSIISYILHTPNYHHIDSTVFIEALIAKNESTLLPAGCMVVRGRAEENPGEGEGGHVKVRVWVDVSPEGVKYLEGASYLLRMLTGAVRLRPVLASPPDKLSEAQPDD